MKYLLDTHILLWAAAFDEKLPENVRKILSDRRFDICYSVINCWELALKESKGKILLPEHFFTQLPSMGFPCLPVKEAHILSLRRLPAGHGDPFDRMLLAQADAEGRTLITRDATLAHYPVQTWIV